MANDESEIISKGIDVVREVGGFIARVIDGPLEQGMGIFEDHLKYYRWERQLRLMEKANLLLCDRGLKNPSRALPIKVALPLFESASIEDDEDIHDMWARLLVNAIDAGSEVNVKKSLVSILSEFEPLDAKIFHEIYSIADPGDRDLAIWTMNLPEKADLEKPCNESCEPIWDVEVSLGNLSRNACIESAMAFGGIAKLAAVHTTRIGWELYMSCRD